MTDDDDLRDAFADDIRAALNTRARIEPIPEVTFDASARPRARPPAARRSTCRRHRGGRNHNDRDAESRHPTDRCRVAAVVGDHTHDRRQPGFRVVSYHGVHVEVPARWPVVDGMHTGFCAGPFPDTATAFVGPQRNGAPSCPYVPSLRDKKRDGVWLQSGQKPNDARPSTTSAGEVLFQDVSARQGNMKYVWFHQVALTVGVGTDAASP